MAKRVLLVGHCGPDSSYLRMTIRKADPQAEIVSADDSGELRQALEQGVELILFNREVGYGFDEAKGSDLIRRLKPIYPNLKMMLVSNYPDAQAEAEKAGALPGFGKRELGSAEVLKLLRSALGTEIPQPAR